MPRIPSERSYDDITYKAGDNRINASGSFSPFTFLCITLILTLLGLVVLYSASYSKAIGLGYPHYHYFARQALCIAATVLAGALLTMLPLDVMAKGFLLLLPLSVVLSVLSFFPGFSFGGMLMIGGCPVLQPASLALFASVFTVAGLLPYTDEERSLRSVISAVISLIVLEALILLSGGIPWFAVSSLVILLMLRRSRMPKLAIFLAFLLMAGAGIGAAFAFPSILSPVFSSAMPVADKAIYDSALSISRQAIADGGIAGAGLGAGLYKLGELVSPESQYIFAVFAEELGGIGMVFLLILFILYLVIGVRTSKRGIEREDGFSASLSYGLSMMIALKAFSNMLYVSGIVPLPGIMLPFFSYSLSECVITMLSSVILYRLVYKMGRKHES